jgi:hypothetical protein
MLIVVALLSLLAGISFPAITAGIESLRLNSACDDIAALLNGALNRAERRQHGVEIDILPAENALVVSSFEPGFRRRLDLPATVRMEGERRRLLVFPGGSPPRVAVELANRRGDRRIVRVDPVSGATMILKPNQPEVEP